MDCERDGMSDTAAAGPGSAPPTTFFLKLHNDPPIYVIKSGWSLMSGFRHCLKDAAGRPFHLLVSPSWHHKALLDQLVTFSATVELMSPGTTVTVMCTGEDEARMLRRHQLKALHAHPNAFIDHRIFRPRPELTRTFDAIYIGAMVPWKRHELAWDVNAMCVVTYRHDPQDSDAPIRGYRHLAYSNLAPDGTVEHLEAERVAGLICRSHCGLILSAAEGQNNASGEYQFCGVPTISTPSEGGRAEFFDKASTIIVAPVADLVRQTVAFAVRNPLDPMEIRKRVMDKAIPHRLRLIDWMSGLAGERLQSRADAWAWLPAFRDKLRVEVPAL